MRRWRGCRSSCRSSGRTRATSIISTSSAPSARDALAAWLKERGVQTGIHYPVPSHRQPAVEGLAAPALPRTERLVSEILTLPISSGHTEEEIDRVAAAVRAYFKAVERPASQRSSSSTRRRITSPAQRSSCASSRAASRRAATRSSIATPPGPHGARLAGAGGRPRHAAAAPRLGSARGVAAAPARPDARGIDVIHAHKGRARTLAILAGLVGPRPRLVLNRGVSFVPGRLNRLGYTTRRVDAIVAVCRSIKDDLVRRRRPGRQDRGHLLRAPTSSASIPAWTARRCAASSASRPRTS